MNDLTVTSEHTYQVIGRILYGPIEREAWADYVENMRNRIAQLEAALKRADELVGILYVPESDTAPAGWVKDHEYHGPSGHTPQAVGAHVGIPALSKYAAAQVAKVNAEKRNERDGKR